MHPLIVVAPIVALLLAPQFVVRRVLKQHNRNVNELRYSGAEVTRELLDQYGLRDIRVESTDLGDHYDPKTKTIRLSRDKFERRSLTAVTTAAHEVGHALQDATGYAPFIWRGRLVRVAQITGEVGSVLFIAVPAAALLTRNPVPATVVGIAAITMLGTGVLAQFAALPTEFDASFNRALPMLERGGYVRGAQIKVVRKILTATSLTYVSSSLASVLSIWPWLGRTIIIHRVPTPPVHRMAAMTALHITGKNNVVGSGSKRVMEGRAQRRNTVQVPVRHSIRNTPATPELLLRLVAKTLIRGWYSVSRNY